MFLERILIETSKIKLLRPIEEIVLQTVTHESTISLKQLVFDESQPTKQVLVEHSKKLEAPRSSRATAVSVTGKVGNTRHAGARPVELENGGRGAHLTLSVLAG